MTGLKSIATVAFIATVFVACRGYQRLELNVENDVSSPNLIRLDDLTYEHVNETTLLVSGTVTVREKITYGTKVRSFKAHTSSCV